MYLFESFKGARVHFSILENRTKNNKKFKEIVEEIVEKFLC